LVEKKRVDELRREGVLDEDEDLYGDIDPEDDAE
jgi:hypothetical protein